jgi:hypothetical protein
MKVSQVVLSLRLKMPLFSVGLGLILMLACTGNANAGSDVLILAPTVTGGIASNEYKIITTALGVAVPGFTSVTGLGLTADIVLPGPGANTWPTPPQSYGLYKAIVLGDPTCSFSSTPVAAAESNAAVWAAAVTGNVVIIGTDPSIHLGAGGISGAQLWKSAIGFAVAGFAAGDGTGAVISLSCYYGSAVPSTPVLVLSGFGTFLTQGASCANTVAIVASSPALTGLTAATLSNWSCSAHEGFTSWPATFMPLALVTDASVPHVFTAGSASGLPYILARGKTLTPASGEILKVCKVAGPGVTVGTPFTFTAGSGTFTVPAGPAPGGTCVVGPSFAAGSTVTVTETMPAGDTVLSIAVAPPAQLIGTPNLAGGSVNVMIGSGVTEVTFTDKRTGYLEICKTGSVRGTFTYTVNPGGLGPFVVPAGACSPAIEVVAGSAIINELPTPGTAMSACNTIPASQQGPCNLGAQTSTVTVVAGNVSTQTIAFITNRRITPGTDTTITVSCATNSTRMPQPVTCTAKVSAALPRTGTPTGTVSFIEAGTILATVQLSPDGTAAFTTSTLAAGTHTIVASYSGDANFDESVSAQFTVTVEHEHL